MKWTAGVVSDTHGVLPSAVFDAFRGVKVIFHCGDVGDPIILTELETIAPVYAVTGNMDPPEVYTRHPTMRRVEIEGRRFVLVHGHLFPFPPERSVRRILKACGDPLPHVLMFGHSHQWYWQRHGDVWALNPGSASRPHAGQQPTVAVLIHDHEGNRWDVQRVALSPNGC